MALSRILITLAAFAAAAVCAGFAFLLPAGGIYAILGPPLVLATPALLGFGIGHLFERRVRRSGRLWLRHHSGVPLFRGLGRHRLLIGGMSVPARRKSTDYEPRNRAIAKEGCE